MPGRLLRLRVVFLVSAGVIAVVLLMIGGYRSMEFADSVAFCTGVCHQPMEPEYVAYQASPHSRVACVECHVGSGGSYLVRSKVSGLPLVGAVLFNTYDRPITTPVDNLRPAREVCEECHRPERFSGDLVRVYHRYGEDENNTEGTSALVFRVGGGEPEVSKGIHWHVAAKVWYLPLDERRQEIGWVGTEADDGEVVEYVDPDRVSEIGPELIDDKKRLMDCVDCHNRATHVFRSPEELIDMALAQGRIDSSLPFIKKEGREALDRSDFDLDAALASIESIEEFYRTSYPEVYQEKREAIIEAIEELKEIAGLTIFPEMRVTWETHPDNLGHQDFPGCFRCHGKLTATTGSQQGQPIDASCDLCHYPIAAPGPVEGPPQVSHPLEGRTECLLCHGSTGIKPFPADHTGRSNSSCFQCHSPFAGDEDAVAPMLATPTPAPATATPTPAPAVATPTPAPAVATPTPAPTVGTPTPVPPVAATPVPAPETATSVPLTATTAPAPIAPNIPHSLEGRADCLLCHAPGGIKPAPADHANRANDTCTLCHKAMEP